MVKLFYFITVFAFILSLNCQKTKTKTNTNTVEIEKPTEPIPPPRDPPRPGFQTIDTIEDSMILDLQNLNSDTERRNARYVIGCDRFNLGDEMAEFEQGVNRGFNQLSSERELYKVVPIGPGNCIYRIDLDAIGWTAKDWELLSNADILKLRSKTIRSRNIQFLTQSKLPYGFASSLLLSATEGDAVTDRKGAIYYSLVKQANLTKDFFAQHGIDRQAQVNDEEALYSAFSSSQIAIGKSRMIAVFEDKQNGQICISTYDTALNGDDVFKNSFTVELAQAGQLNGNLLTNKIFRHNAQEHICNLNNGLWGLYRLNNANDTAEVAAPNNIVINLSAAAEQLDPTIRIGDCGVCHFNKGVAIAFRDQLRAHILNNTAYNQDEKKLADIFFRYDKITAQIDELNRNHSRVMAELGITAEKDPMWYTVMLPLRKEMRLEQVASLLWFDPVTFKERLQGAAISSQVFGNLLTGGNVNLATLSANFQTLIDETGAYQDADL